jgi:hypothetical protein
MKKALIPRGFKKLIRLSQGIFHYLEESVKWREFG